MTELLLVEFEDKKRKWWSWGKKRSNKALWKVLLDHDVIIQSFSHCNVLKWDFKVSMSLYQAVGVSELWNVNDYSYHNWPGSSSGTESQTLSSGTLAPVLLCLFPCTIWAGLKAYLNSYTLVSANGLSSGSTRGSRPQKVEEVETGSSEEGCHCTGQAAWNGRSSVCCPGISSSSLYFFFAEAGWKTGEPVVRESFPMSYKEGLWHRVQCRELKENCFFFTWITRRCNKRWNTLLYALL